MTECDTCNDPELISEFRTRQKLRIGSRILAICGYLLITAYILYGNFTPFGITKTLVKGQDHEISDFEPKERVLGIQSNQDQTDSMVDDLIYFNTDMRYKYDKASFNITFQNPYPDQELYLGYKDSVNWHYQSKLIDSPLLDSIDWYRSGDSPILYQRVKQYANVEELIKNPPQYSIVGVYNYDPEILKQFSTKIPDYKPSQTDTVIDVPLRGKHTMYVYVDKEPFKMQIVKQDLNWYDNPDILTVKIYKDNDLVYENSINDDGITDNSKKISTPQVIEIENPGPELPESGVYKVILDANSDIVIKRITTNLHKIVFESPIFPVENHEIYPQIVSKTKSTHLVTDALYVSALTFHSTAHQTIKVGENNLAVSDEKRDFTASSSIPIIPITVPINDVILKGFLGYFAFSPNQFFRPTDYFILPITTKDDIDLVDYILTDYKPPQKNGDWLQSHQSFDLGTAKISNGKLNWLIRSPDLKMNERSIQIKNITASFTKNPVAHISL